MGYLGCPTAQRPGLVALEVQALPLFPFALLILAGGRFVDGGW
jgi:hypothetical protein